MRCQLCGTGGEHLVRISAELPGGEISGSICLLCLGNLAVPGGRRLLNALHPERAVHVA